MQPKEHAETLIFSGLSLLAVILCLTGLLQLTFNLLESWYYFDPNYLGSFFLQVLIRPLLFILSAFLLKCSARRLSRFLAASR
jgi:hypothetical protein